MSVKFIHLSDIHLGDDLEDDENKNFKSIQDELINKYKGEKQKPLIIITGDIVDSGENPKQFIIAAKQFEKLYNNSFTVWTIPGNHDYGRGGFIDSGGFKRFKNNIVDYESPYNLINGDAKYPQVREFLGHSFFGLNSLIGKTGRFTQGNLGDQIDDLYGKLKADKEQNRKRKRIVFLHNHPFYFRKKYQWGKEYYYENTLTEIRDSKAFMDAIKELADVLLFGHHHFFVNFSKSSIARDYKIECILSCGKSTNGDGGKKEGSREFGIDKNDRVDLNSCLNTRMYGWEIVIDNSITVNPLIYKL